MKSSSCYPLDSCRSCPAGKYQDGCICRLCPEGTMADRPGRSRCLPCDAGHYSANYLDAAGKQGATVCGSCKAGTYSLTQKSSCTACPLGKSSHGCSSTNEEKRHCDAAYLSMNLVEIFNDNRGGNEQMLITDCDYRGGCAGGCIECFPGTYTNTTGAGGCIGAPCPSGQYKDNVCVACPYPLPANAVWDSNQPNCTWSCKSDFEISGSGLSQTCVQSGAPSYYENTSTILSILSQPEAWMGAGYDNGGGASYLFRPLKDMPDQACQPKTGKPSKCAVDSIYLRLHNPPTQPVSGGRDLFLNMTMLLKSNVFLNSPGAEGYFEMPHVCEYERNHSVLALFNASNGKVDFTILDTHLDSLGCHNRVPAGKEQPGVMHRCGAPGGPPQKCYKALDNTQFKGLFRLGPRRSTDPLNVPHHLEIVMRFPYKVYGPTSWSDFNERTKTNYIPRISEPYAITNWATQRELQIFRYSLYPWTPTQPLAFLGPNGEWFRDRRAKIERVDPPFGPQDGGNCGDNHRTRISGSRARGQSKCQHHPAAWINRCGRRKKGVGRSSP